MHQALRHELNSLPQSVQAESMSIKPSHGQAIRHQKHLSRAVDQMHISSSSALHAEAVEQSALEPAGDDIASAEAVEEAQEAPSVGLNHSRADSEHAEHDSAGMANQSLSHKATPATLHQEASDAQPHRQTAQEQLQHRKASAQLPITGLQHAASSSGGLHRASSRVFPRAPQGRGPSQAMPAQSTFLRATLSELLRLTHPTQSQYQPISCGWYSTGEGLLAQCNNAKPRIDTELNTMQQCII